MKTMFTAALIACALAAGCVTQPTKVDREAAVEVQVVEQEPVQRHDPEPETQCPALPAIPDKATRFEGRLWTLTVIELYKQCAASKGKR